MNEFNYENEIIEISSDNEDTNTKTLEELIKEEIEKKDDGNNKKKKRKKLNLTKKQKIIIITSIVIALIVIFLLLYFFVFKKDKEKEVVEEPVIVEKDNYRYENGKLIFLDNNEKELGSYECENKNSELCFVTKNNYETDSFDRVKSIYENGEELVENSKIYLNKFIFISDNEKTFLYDFDSQETLLEVTNIKSYDTSRDIVVITDEDGKVGIIEIKEDGFEYLIRPSYDNLSIINNDELLVLAQDKENYYIIDIEGKKLSSNMRGTIKSADSNYIVTEVNNTYALYNYENEELLSDYEFISLHDKVIALVKSKRLYLIDSELNKLMEDGIRLNNTDYVKEYVYNSNNRLIETKKSYEINISNDNVNVVIGNDTKTYNILEGKLSSIYSYLSYLDNKLYIYSDEDKVDILGTYSCKNKNTVTSSETNLTNCGIYYNEEGISGIYNNEYIFIYDYADTENKVYYLYSLKDKKVMGTYSEIEIVKDTELDNQIRQIYTSSSYIIAKAATGNNKGNYGVVEITSEKVQGKVAFSYESIVLENNYYKLLSKDKTYSLYNNTFTKISNEFSDIKLYANYYVGVNNNKLNIYRYDNTLGVLQNDLIINSSNYEIDFTNGFKITVDGTEYNYDTTGKLIVNNSEEVEDGE